MGDRNLNIIFAIVGLCLISSAVGSERRNHCPGPIKYYEELGCTPVFKHFNDPCPIRYNCDKWANLTENQCLVNGHVYEEGESLRNEDSNPCDDCTCYGSAGWACMQLKPSQLTFAFSEYGRDLECYTKRNTYGCHSEKPICIKEKDRPTCVVDGKTYKDGELFVPLTDPEKRCYCGEGYTGENIESFCVTAKHTWCNHVLFDAVDIRANCIPIYGKEQSLNTECKFLHYRCQNDIDHVINPKPKSEPENPEMLCKFGKMTMQIGEELARDRYFNWGLITCICEVPPIPTCRKMT